MTLKGCTARLRPAPKAPDRASRAWVPATEGSRKLPVAPTLLALVPAVVVAESLLRRR